MDEIRMGVVGLGSRGRYWLWSLQRMRGFRVTAICDPIPGLRDQARAQLDDPDGVAVHSTYEELLADSSVDAVALCVRCKEQGAMAAQALEAGKHVNAEVPAAHTLQDCWRIVVAQERSGLVYQLAEQARYWGFVDAWKQLVAEDRLGRVTYADGEYFGYYPHLIFRHPNTGARYDLGRAKGVAPPPEFQPTWLALMPPIHYLPHNLSPLMKMLDDRVIEVVGMGTRAPSYRHPEVPVPDVQVALMKTSKDCVLRLAAGFTQPVPAYHVQWFRLKGTKGIVQMRFSPRDYPKMYLADAQMHEFAEVDWRLERTDAPPEAAGTGHGSADYYVHAYFRDAVLEKQPLDLDVYQAIETAAPAVLAAQSIEQGSKLLPVPDFRPNDKRPAGRMPADLYQGA
jgi:predicted dehydrogenase